LIDVGHYWRLHSESDDEDEIVPMKLDGNVDGLVRGWRSESVNDRGGASTIPRGGWRETKLVG